MGITRSYNKNNGICYAYETTYEWDEEKQRKIQKKRCIGQFVPGTNEIIPNGPRGKKPQGGTPIIRQQTSIEHENHANSVQATELESILAELKTFESSLAGLSAATRELANKLANLEITEHS